MCLQVNMPEHDACKMVQGGLLFSNLSGGGWHFYRCLDFGCLAHQWFNASHGVGARAEKTLTHCFPLKINSVCCKCMKAGTEWAASQYFQFVEYCSS